MPFCRDCGKEVQDDWATCPYCSNSVDNEKSKQNQERKNNPNDISYSSPVIVPAVVMKNETDNSLKHLVTLGVCILIVIILVSTYYVYTNSDSDGDGIKNTDDWYDLGDGGLKISFTKFQIWSEGNYDNGGKPDVYAYVGIGDGNCRNMQYFEYLDDINYDVSVLTNWKEYIANIDDDETHVCVTVTIYDENSWAVDDVLDFVPGDAKSYKHTFVLSAGEGDISIYEDNRGENDLSILLEYDISRVAVILA